ncbi:MAG: heavy-metal-associated domain-containing protein, partial [Candidatus Anammoxibacter sp.]
MKNIMEQNKTINSGCQEFHEFHILGLNCMDCAGKIEHAISKLKWVKNAKVHFSTSLLKITTKDGTKDIDSMEEEIEKQITGLGFGIDKGRMAAITFNTNGIISDLDAEKIRKNVFAVKGIRKLDILESKLIKI